MEKGLSKAQGPSGGHPLEVLPSLNRGISEGAKSSDERPTKYVKLAREGRPEEERTQVVSAEEEAVDLAEQASGDGTGQAVLPDGAVLLDLGVPPSEVVRLDLSDLAEDEAETILGVLGKDSVFRAEEKGRIDKIEAEVHEETVRQRSQEQRHKNARRACLRCGQTFRILFNKRLECQLCGASVCRRCARYEHGRRGWLCLVCERERELQANKWLSEIQLKHRVSIRTSTGSRFSDSEDDSGYDPSVSHDDVPRPKPPGGPALRDPDHVTAEVRGHLENVVETLLGESIQTASIKPSLADRPLDESCSPTTTVAELKAVLQQAQQAAMRLPLRQEADGTPLGSLESRAELTSPDGCGEEPNSHTYEEILATAVLSRLGEKARRPAAAAPAAPAAPPAGFCDAAVQSEDVTPLQACDVTSLGAGAAPRSRSEAEDSESEGAGYHEEEEEEEEGSSVLEITIEEEIEEIMMYENEEEGDHKYGNAPGSRRESVASQSSTAKSSSSAEGSGGEDVSLPGLSISYSDLDFAGGQSVPFPELGTSLPQVSPPEDSASDADRTSWEENWLFRRRRLTQANRLLGEEAVPMLVPDPSQRVAVTVGSRDVDELSDLSERGSESSLEEWRSVSPAGDVTARLRAARDADRDRYLTGRLVTAHSKPATAADPGKTRAPGDGERHSTESARPAAAPASRAAAAAGPAEAPSRSASSPHDSELDIERAFCEVSERLAADESPFEADRSSSDCLLRAERRFSEAAVEAVSPAERTPSARELPPGACAELVSQTGCIAHFRCKVPVDENSETHWLRDGVVLEPSDRYEMYRVRHHHHLVLYDACRRDSGRYSCLVTAAGAETWHHFTLKVLASSRTAQKPYFTLVPERRHQVVSDSAQIERHSGGEWVLVLRQLTEVDAGAYQVQAANSHGSARHQFEVAVLPRPEPPPLPETPVVQRESSAPVRPRVRLTPATSPPASYVTSRDEALKETSLTEACNSVILRARPARVRSPVEGGRDSESDGEEICRPQLRSGTIAEREYRKWENAVAMPNNPYTLERVRQRHSRPVDRTGYYSSWSGG
ncbi:uncharacterized protein LOC119106133 [Pollicipes pollicipes]|uniref:uncharacterized protein LOC119106133 n=1 Tax=Pollicipes pollicipes TaxID=41117 RepID=UPI001885150E|nr:uncharacterized protein LOC119106133 [Pollicipes pollicipes]